MNKAEGVFLMIFERIRMTISALAAFFVAAVVFLFVRATNAQKLGAYEGTRTYYLDSASSQSLMTTGLCGWDFLRVKGESVRIEGGVEDGFVQRVLATERACVQFVEEVDGVTSYYCYTPQWQESVYVAGKKVNLHIAVGESGCVIGYPIIFGGY